MNAIMTPTGEVQEGLLDKQALAFLALGEMYDLQDLKKMAETELLSGLNKENMVEMISNGDYHKADQLLEAALKFTKANMAWLRSQVWLIAILYNLYMGCWVWKPESLKKSKKSDKVGKVGFDFLSDFFPK